jgi:arsenate reductase
VPDPNYPVTIFHNSACGTSRNTIALVEAAGYQPKIVEYLKTGWTVDQLKGLLLRMGASPRDILRVRGTPAESLGLLADGVSDEVILQAMTEHPILVERPIVETPKGVVLARPKEKVADVLP